MAPDESDTTHDDAITPKQAEADALDQRREALNDDRERFLRTHGWQYTSQFPDCRWRWWKSVNGNRITEGDADAAVRLERWLP